MLVSSFVSCLQQWHVRTWPARYELLDGLRGLACITVVLQHLGVATIGHYAVMVFFVISGCCITAATQSSLRRGLSLGDFIRRRVQRIFPPYLLAVAFFAATRMIKTTLDPSLTWSPTLLQWLQNLTLTQWLSLPFNPVAQATQNSTLFVAAFWSLNYEEQFYLVMGLAMLLAVKWRMPVLNTVLMLLVLGLAWNVAVPGGWITGFFIEYWVHFALGSLLYFLLCESFPLRSARVMYLSGLCSLVVFSVWQLWHWQGQLAEDDSRVYVELLVVSIVCLILYVLRPFSEAISRSLIWRPVALVGAISYSLYLVHQFNLRLVETLVNHIVPRSVPATVHILCGVLLHIGIGAAFWWACERPFLNIQRKPLHIAEQQPAAANVAN
jgi:peptidoglycan/LPS O-acetylase OafA/YrhL